MRSLLTFAAAFLIVSCAIAGPNKLPFCPKVLSTGGGSGSCVVVADGWVLTAKHVRPFVAVLGVGKVLEVVLHPTADLALLRVAEAKAEDGVKLATRTPQFGEVLHAIGWHYGHLLLVTTGHQGMRDKMSCEVVAGCSGGPVLNSRNQLVGIVHAVYMAPVIDGNTEAMTNLVAPQAHLGWYTPVDKEARAWIRKTTK